MSWTSNIDSLGSRINRIGYRWAMRRKFRHRNHRPAADVRESAVVAGSNDPELAAFSSYPSRAAVATSAPRTSSPKKSAVIVPASPATTTQNRDSSNSTAPASLPGAVNF
jgi:hypothetical protein